MGEISDPIQQDIDNPDAHHISGKNTRKFIFYENGIAKTRPELFSMKHSASTWKTKLIGSFVPVIQLEFCTFCGRAVIDDSGCKTEGYGLVRKGKYLCSRCAKAFEFSIGF